MTYLQKATEAQSRRFNTCVPTVNHIKHPRPAEAKAINKNQPRSHPEPTNGLGHLGAKGVWTTRSQRSYDWMEIQVLDGRVSFWVWTMCYFITLFSELGMSHFVWFVSPAQEAALEVVMTPAMAQAAQSKGNFQELGDRRFSEEMYFCCMQKPCKNHIYIKAMNFVWPWSSTKDMAITFEEPIWTGLANLSDENRVVKTGLLKCVSLNQNCAMDTSSGKATPFVDADLLYQVGALIIETLALLRLVVLAASALRGRGWQVLPSLRSKYRNLVARWTAKPQLNQSTVEQLDWFRCRITLRVWNVTFAFVMFRLVYGQVVEALGFQKLLPVFDYNMLFYAAVGLLLNFRPSLITPRSLDVWYVGTSLILNLTLLPAASVEVRDVLVLTFPLRFLFAVLAKRTWCFVLCTLVNILQIFRMSRLQAAEEVLEDGNIISLPGGVLVFAVSMMMFLGIFLARGLLEENAILKQDLQGRTVELGAVSSLLTACYDAVLEATWSREEMWRNAFRTMWSVGGWWVCKLVR